MFNNIIFIRTTNTYEYILHNIYFQAFIFSNNKLYNVLIYYYCDNNNFTLPIYYIYKPHTIIII